MIEEDRGRSRKIEEDRGRSRKIEEIEEDRGRSRKIEEDRGRSRKRSRKIEEKIEERSRKDRGRSRKIEENAIPGFPDNDVLRIFWAVFPTMMFSGFFGADGTSVKRQRRCPKVSSMRTETSSRLKGEKLA